MAGEDGSVLTLPGIPFTFHSVATTADLAVPSVRPQTNQSVRSQSSSEHIRRQPESQAEMRDIYTKDVDHHSLEAE